jgi:CRP-like cAMP-binding protein
MKMTTRRPRLDPTEAMAAEANGWTPAGPRAREAASALVDAPIFAGIDLPEIREILDSFEEVRFPSGRRVLLEGLRGSDFFVMVAGKATVLVDGWRVATLGPGDFFGEMAILGAGLRTASIRAETPLHCLVLPNGKLEQLLLDHPRLGLSLLHSLVGRFASVSGRQQPPVVEVVGS